MEKLKKEAEELVNLIESTLNSTKLPENENSTTFLAILIKDLTIFKVVLKLIDFNDTGAACMILGRTIVESVIAVEFMKLKGMDKMLTKFRLFEFAEAKHDIDYLRRVGMNVEDLNPTEIEAKFKENINEFERKPGEAWRSWAHTDFDGMVEELLKSRHLSSDGFQTILSTYIQGSRMVHLSPQNIKFYILGESIMYKRNMNNTRLAFISSVFSILRIATMFGQYIKNQSFVDNLDTIFKKTSRKIS